MSSLDTDGDDTPDDDTDAARTKDRTPWEIQEIVAVALLGGIAVLAVTGVAAGIISTTIQSGHLFSQPAGQVIIESTQWAGLLTAFMLLCTLALAWWQVEGWTEALDDLADEEPSDNAEGESFADEVDEAWHHIRRNRSLATWAGVSIVISAMAAIAALIGIVIEQTPVGLAALNWNTIAAFGGEALAVSILAGAGVYVAWIVRRKCDDTLVPQPTAAAGEE